MTYTVSSGTLNSTISYHTLTLPSGAYGWKGVAGLTRKYLGSDLLCRLLERRDIR